jgi:hypothetical protein
MALLPAWQRGRLAYDLRARTLAEIFDFLTGLG